MITLPLLLAASMVSALPAPSHPEGDGIEADNNKDGVVGESGRVELPPPDDGTIPVVDPTQRWSWLSPTVDYQPEGKWKTSNLGAFTEEGPANASVSGTGSGIHFDTDGNVDDLTIYVNGTDAKALQSTDWGKNAKVNITSSKHPHGNWNIGSAEVKGLDYGYYEFTLGAKGNLSFDGAVPITDGLRWGVLPANKTDIGKATQYVKKEGNWDDSNGFWRATEKGAKIIIEPPIGTTLLELTAGQPPVPFGDFKVTITPPPPFGPAHEEFHPNLEPGNVQAAIYNGNIPIYSAILNPNFLQTVEIEYTGDGQDERGGGAFVVHEVTFFPLRPPEIQNGTAPTGPRAQPGTLKDKPTPAPGTDTKDKPTPAPGTDKKDKPTPAPGTVTSAIPTTVRTDGTAQPGTLSSGVVPSNMVAQPGTLTSANTDQIAAPGTGTAQPGTASAAPSSNNNNGGNTNNQSNVQNGDGNESEQESEQNNVQKNADGHHRQHKDGSGGEGGTAAPGTVGKPTGTPGGIAEAGTTWKDGKPPTTPGGKAEAGTTWKDGKPPTTPGGKAEAGTGPGREGGKAAPGTVNCGPEH